MKAHIFTAFVWTAVDGGYIYDTHAFAATTSAEAEAILKGDGLTRPGDAVFILTDEHVNDNPRSAILAYYTKWDRESGPVPVREYVKWVDYLTKPSIADGKRVPAAYRMV